MNYNTLGDSSCLYFLKSYPSSSKINPPFITPILFFRNVSVAVAILRATIISLKILVTDVFGVSFPLIKTPVHPIGSSAGMIGSSTDPIAIAIVTVGNPARITGIQAEPIIYPTKIIETPAKLKECPEELNVHSPIPIGIPINTIGYQARLTGTPIRLTGGYAKLGKSPAMLIGYSTTRIRQLIAMNKKNFIPQ